MRLSPTTPHARTRTIVVAAPRATSRWESASAACSALGARLSAIAMVTLAAVGRMWTRAPDIQLTGAAAPSTASERTETSSIIRTHSPPADVRQACTVSSVISERRWPRFPRFCAFFHNNHCFMLINQPVAYFPVHLERGLTTLSGFVPSCPERLLTLFPRATRINIYARNLILPCNSYYTRVHPPLTLSSLALSVPVLFAL